MPNELWVFDQDAKKLASRIFKKTQIKLKKNFYWDEIYRKSRKNNKTLKKNSLLFFSSNYDSIKKYDNKIIYSDKEILDIFLNNFFVLFPKKIISSKTIALHPSEGKNKYTNIYLKKNNIKKEYNKDLLDLISSHEYIIGSESMAIVIAKICKKKTMNLYQSKKLHVIPKKFIDKNISLKKLDQSQKNF